MFNKILKQQYLLLLGIIILLSIVCIFLCWRLSKQTTPQPKIVKSQITTALSRVNPQEVWVHDLTARYEVNQKRLDTIEKALEKLLTINTKEINTQELTSFTNNVNNAVTTVTDLKQEIAGIQQNTNLQAVNNLPLINPLATNFSGNIKFKSTELKKISLNLAKANIKPLKTTDNTIPAGSFAKGILLGGVDASTSIQAASDPRPILLRLIHPGTLPRKFQSDLDGCHVLAASYGDISSERVFMRLENLSCVERKTGEVIDLKVQGYVAGEDGKAGVRGQIVDRSNETMRNAMIGGFFSSMGKFLGQPKTPLLFSPTTGFSQNNPMTTNDLLKQSAANGGHGALDKYADFYIKRAEQMQPVIQVAAGRLVDLVFTQGLDFSGSQLRQTLSKARDQQREEQIKQFVEPYHIQDHQ